MYKEPVQWRQYHSLSLAFTPGYLPENILNV